MLDPEPADAPVIAPVLVPNVHTKVLGTLALRVRPVLVPLHILLIVAEVNDGAGFTVIVIGVIAPIQEPTVEVGVTLYTMLPAVILLGLLND